MKSLISSLSFLFLISFSSFAQSQILEAYIEQAKKENLSTQSEHLKRNKQIVKLAQAEKNWAPSLDLAGNYLLSQGGRTIQFPIGDLFNPVYGTLNQLTQSNEFPTDLENQEIQLTPNNFIDLQVSLTKPILNSSIKYNSLIQKELIALNDVGIEIAEQEIGFQVRQAYFSYLKTIEAFAILDETETLLNQLMAFNNKLIKYDKATPEVVSDVEFQLAAIKSQRAALREQSEIAKSYFNILLNRPLDTDIEMDEKILASFTQINLDLSAEKAKGLNNRVEFKQLDIATKVQDLNTTLIEKERQPTVGLRAAVGLQTENFNFDNGGPLYTLGVGMNWNIFDGGKRAKRIEEIVVDQKIIENNRSQLNQKIEIEIAQIFFALKSLEQKMEAENAAVKSATTTHRFVKANFENQKAILIQLNDARNKMVTAKLNRILTKYDYLIKLAALKRATQS